MLARQAVRTSLLCRRGLSLLATFSQPKAVSIKRGNLRFAINTLQTRSYQKAETIQQVMPPKQQTYKDIEERVLKAIRAWDRFPQDRADKLDLNADFAKDLGLDSLDHVEMMLSVEAEFEMEIDEDTTEKFTSPRRIYDYMCERFDVYK